MALFSKRGKLLTLAVGLVNLLPGVAKAEDEYLTYDFSDPARTFAATLGQSVVGSGVDLNALYQLLGAGQLVIVNEQTGRADIPWMTTSGTVVNAPPDAVYAVIEGYEHYSEFMPQTKGAWAKAVNPDIDHVFYELAIKVLFLSVDVPYSVYHYYQRPRRVDWVMAGGELEVNVGAYEVIPVPGDATRSMLFYTSYSLPRTAAVKSLFDKIPQLDKMINLSTGTLVVRAMKGRVEALAKATGQATSPPVAKAPALQTLIQSHTAAVETLSTRGQVVFLEEGAPMFYTGSVVIDRPKQAVYEALAAVEGLPATQEQARVKVVSQQDGSAVAEVETIIQLMVDFRSKYVVDYAFEAPSRITWKGRPGGDIEGAEGSWELMDLPGDRTLLLYRSTADLASSGMTMRQVLKVEPTFELGILASQTLLMTGDAKWYCEASPEARQKKAAAVGP